MMAKVIHCSLLICLSFLIPANLAPPSPYTPARLDFAMLKHSPYFPTNLSLLTYPSTCLWFVLAQHQKH